MAPRRSPGGQNSSTRLDEYDPEYDEYESDDLDGPVVRRVPNRLAGLNRLPAPSSSARGRAVFAAVALGAIAAATAGQSLLPHGAAHQPTILADAAGTAVIGTSGDNQQSIEVAPVARTVDASAEAQQVAESQRITGQGSGLGSSQPSQTTGVTFAKPTEGTITSTFGGHYGNFHYGIEIANAKDTPIMAVANGTIIAAGPTSGFGQWVKEQLSDGTTLVYARTDSFSVQVGQQVTAGQQIALMGNRGFSTGYSLHFEVWDPSGKKVDPVQWLNTRGITI